MQNISHAVMSQRVEPIDSRDDFPTPPWATRALIEHVLPEVNKSMTCLEPACGAGHMSKVLEEYFDEVNSSDIYNYGYGAERDFLAWQKTVPNNQYDWVITNPPFKLAEEFIVAALDIAREGVAILARTVFLESVGRYNRLFSERPPAKFAQFVERVPMVKGRLDAKASTATGYSWFVWEKKMSDSPELIWIPPCRRTLEREGDYELPERAVSRGAFAKSDSKGTQVELFECA